jgi:Protein of unknown function (DUF2541)
MFRRDAMRLAGVLFILMIFGSASYAQRYDRWIYLGESNVDGNVDHDKIKIGRDDGRFRALQIRVERAPIEFQRVVVHYGNGSAERIDIRNRIRPGGKTRVINLRGNDRVIESVEVWYARARYKSDKPKLRLFGLT